MGKFDPGTFPPTKVHLPIRFSHSEGGPLLGEIKGFVWKPGMRYYANAMLVPLPPANHKWVCVPKKPKRKGTRKESSQ